MDHHARGTELDQGKATDGTKGGYVMDNGLANHTGVCMALPANFLRMVHGLVVKDVRT